jgi:hypothetical protein
LYNGLADLLGRERTETLMAALPSYDMSNLARRVTSFLLGARIDGLESRLASVEGIVNGLGQRMDRMFLTLIAGLFVIVATMAGVPISL